MCCLLCKVVAPVVLVSLSFIKLSEKKDNIFVMLNCQSAHLVITYILLTVHPALALSLLLLLVLFISLFSNVSHLACHTHANAVDTNSYTHPRTSHTCKM